MQTEEKSKMVLVWRKDLKVRKGKIAAQMAHGAVANITNNLVGHPFSWWWFPLYYLKFLIIFLTRKSFRNWFISGFKKISVYVDNEKELVKIYALAQREGLICSLIVDAGDTEFGGVPTRTVVAIGPDYSSKIDKVTGHLKLL